MANHNSQTSIELVALPKIVRVRVRVANTSVSIFGKKKHNGQYIGQYT